MKKKGFTLIEILIVLLIVGILASLALLRSGTEGRESAKVTADRLKSVLIYAQQQAILQAAVIGFDYNNKKGYQFSYYKAGEWQAITTDAILGLYPLPLKIQLIVSPADKHPAIIFLPSGEITPFKINIYFNGKKTPYQITGAANGDIQNIKAL